MELNALKAIAVLIGLVLLWLVIKNSTQRTPRGGYPGGDSYNYQAPVPDGYANSNGYQAPRQDSGCLRVLAVIGFLAICIACVILGIVLAGNL